MKTKKRTIRKATFRFDKDLFEKFISYAESKSLNITKALEMLMKRAVKRMPAINKELSQQAAVQSLFQVATGLGKLAIGNTIEAGNAFASADILGTVAKIEDNIDIQDPKKVWNIKPLTSITEVNEAIEKIILDRKVGSATTILKDYLVKENLVENVIEGPMIKDVFGGLKVIVKLNFNPMAIVAADVETQKLTLHREGTKVEEIK